MDSITVTTSPSLALIKYWGKSDSVKNIPATSSLAITLDDLHTKTIVTEGEKDQVFINGKEASAERFAPFFNNLRSDTRSDMHFLAKSETNFPVAAGLASSSSGFAALAIGSALLIDPTISFKDVSAYARLGSASAARSVYGGFTVLRKDAEHADPLNFDWPELRVILAIVTEGEKPISSRKAMEFSRNTSPFYTDWLELSENLFMESLILLHEKNLKTLGPLIRHSYLSMFSTMLTSTPPTIYWKPESVALIQTCEALRRDGFDIWETMDAGPQVKMICLEDDLEKILERLNKAHPDVKFLTSKVGGAPRL
jgi:diphosphomevalonate decarboxylase